MKCPDLGDNADDAGQWKVCSECGHEFEIGNKPTDRRRKYCSGGCRAEAARRNAWAHYQRIKQYDFNDGDTE